MERAKEHSMQGADVIDPLAELDAVRRHLFKVAVELEHLYDQRNGFEERIAEARDLRLDLLRRHTELEGKPFA